MKKEANQIIIYTTEDGNVFQIVAISGHIGMEQTEFQNKVVNSFKM